MLDDIYDYQLEDVASRRSKKSNSKNEDQKSKKILFSRKKSIMKQKNCEYNPNHIPGDFQKAQIHRDASGVGIEIDEENIQIDKNIEFCECCAKIVDKTQLKLNCSITELAFLGSGYPLFFLFIKFCLLILIVWFLISGLFNILTNNSLGNDCKPNSESDQCALNWTTKYSLGNKKRAQRIADSECDELDVSASDYTVLIKNIPISYQALNNDYDEDLKEFLEKNAIPGKETVIQQVNLVYNIQDQKKLEDQLMVQIKKKQNVMKTQSDNDPLKTYTIDYINEDINKIKEELLVLNDKFQQGKGKHFMEQYFIGWAYVSFEKQQDKDKFIELRQIDWLDKLLKRKQPLNYQGNDIQIEQAPAATDINWKNLYQSTFQKVIRRSFSILLTFVLLFTCFISIFGILELQQKILSQWSDQDGLYISLLSSLIAIIITSLNIMMAFIFEYLADFEVYSTVTEFNISISKKLAASQFINSGLLTCIIKIIIPGRDKAYGNIFGNGGLIYNQNFIFISNMIVPSFIQAVFLPGLIKKLKIKYYKLKKDQCFLTQQELNQAFEKPPFQIQLYYAGILNTMYCTAFYSPILPLAIIYSVVSLSFIYWCYKYNLLNRVTVKSFLSAKLSIEMTEMLEYVLPIYSISIAFFQYIMEKDNNDIPLLPIVGCIVGIVHAFLPMQAINQYVFNLKDQAPNSLTYKEASIMFLTDYVRENPATKKYGIDQHLKQLKTQYKQKVQRASLKMQLINSPKFKGSKQYKKNLKKSAFHEQIIDLNDDLANSNLNVIDVKQNQEFFIPSDESSYKKNNIRKKQIKELENKLSIHINYFQTEDL